MIAQGLEMCVRLAGRIGRVSCTRCEDQCMRVEVEKRETRERQRGRQTDAAGKD